jgi:hypothetical protein
MPLLMGTQGLDFGSPGLPIYGYKLTARCAHTAIQFATSLSPPQKQTRGPMMIALT